MKLRMYFLVLVALATLSLSFCSKDADRGPSKTYVLVHGSFQAAYVWENVADRLRKAGQQVVVVELPGHGTDSTHPAQLSIDAYKQAVLQAAAGIKGKFVLVGHSMGGVVVTATAEAIPNRIDKLIYIAGFVPANDQSLTDLAYQDPTSQLGPVLIPSADRLTLDLPRDKIAPIFVQDGSAAVQALVVEKFRPEPAIPYTNKITVTSGNYGKVDKYYIHTGQDHAIGMGLQKQMVKAAGITKTYTLNSSHSPFLSMPDKVATLLLDIAR